MYFRYFLHDLLQLRQLVRGVDQLGAQSSHLNYHFVRLLTQRSMMIWFLFFFDEAKDFGWLRICFFFFFSIVNETIILKDRKSIAIDYYDIASVELGF